MKDETVRIWLECPHCHEGFIHYVDNSGAKALGLLGAATGGTLGTKLGAGAGLLGGALVGTKAGAILGPVGMAAGLVIGAGAGLFSGKKFGEKFDKPQCPKCGVKFHINAGFPKITDTKND